MSIVLQVEKHKEGVHFNYLYIRLAAGSELNYILVIKDNVISYTGLHAYFDAYEMQQQIFYPNGFPVWIVCIH